jgi:hypothetical protein
LQDEVTHEIIWEPPFLRHFTARFAPVEAPVAGA